MVRRALPLVLTASVIVPVLAQDRVVPYFQQSRAAAQASVKPGMPAASLRTSTRPIAPRPATATRVIGMSRPWAR